MCPVICRIACFTLIAFRVDLIYGARAARVDRDLTARLEVGGLVA